MIQDRGWNRLCTTLALLGAVGLAGCAGENLFTAQIATNQNGPKPTITSPADGSPVVLNSSLVVTFDIDAPDGAASYTALGRYVGQELSAYESVSQALGATAVSASATMAPAIGQVTGEVYVVVEISDIDGDTGRDSVRVTIEN